MLFFLVIIFCAVNVEGNEGDKCRQGDVTGVCTDLRRCPTAMQDIRNRKNPQICSFKNSDPVVCCVGTSTGATLGQGHKVCPPIANSFTAGKTGQKAFDKCLEYQELVFPCHSGERVNRCHHESKELIVGNFASKHEFPHSALLGYGNDTSKLQWLCGGALVSDRFILTAAHCASSRVFGPITYAALRTLDADEVSPDHRHKVKRILKHPDFKPNRIYHDIALLELDTSLELDAYSTPACLVPSGEGGDLATSTTWNTNDVLGTREKILKTMTLTKATTAECAKTYPDSRRGGFNETTQLCYKDRGNSRDICQDDGGNPLLVNSRLRCMYSIIGIVSLGKGCLSHSPGVYTRVEPYVPWIESIVWA